jgi:hypothetical protein
MQDRTLAIRSLIALVAACGSDGTHLQPQPDASEGPPGERVGSVNITEDRQRYDVGQAEFRSSGVFAAFYANAPTSYHHETAAVGACKLVEYTPGNCPNFCEESVCLDNVCMPWPVPLAAGRLTIQGLAVAVSLDPQSGLYYPSNILPENLFGDDAAITAKLSGGDFPAVTLTARGLPPLASSIDFKIDMPSGADKKVTWTPVNNGRVRLTINSNNRGHGIPYDAIITCEAEDAAGEITIPHELIDVFPKTAAWTACAGSDCPSSYLQRYARGRAVLDDGREVELVVSSRVGFYVVHDKP